MLLEDFLFPSDKVTLLDFMTRFQNHFNIWIEMQYTIACMHAII